MCIICEGKDISELTVLDCRYCTSLTALPELPAGLRELWCYGCTSLTVLPKLPVGLGVLNCGGCSSLTVLPDLPAGLRDLWCIGCTVLTGLPELPAGLQKMWCSGCTSLTTLPNLPTGLEMLVCNDCASLTALPDLPAELEFFLSSGCTWLPNGNEHYRENIRKLRLIQRNMKNFLFNPLGPMRASPHTRTLATTAAATTTAPRCAKLKLNFTQPLEKPRANSVCEKAAQTADVPISGLLSLAPDELVEFIEPIVDDTDALTRLFKCPAENVRRFNELLKASYEGEQVSRVELLTCTRADQEESGAHDADDCVSFEHLIDSYREGSMISWNYLQLVVFASFDAQRVASALHLSLKDTEEVLADAAQRAARSRCVEESSIRRRTAKK